MTFSEQEKLKRLKETFECNFALTNMYARYLENYPEFITKELVDELTADTDITPHEAVVALLSQIFELDDEKGGKERRLIRQYISKSVRILDTERYTGDDYYRFIAPNDVRLGEWEFKWEYYPPYRASIGDDMIIEADFTEIPPLVFFTNGFKFPAVLEGGNEWMTLTPVDVDTCSEAIESARGKVITFGLGLGYYTYKVSEKDCVDSITVIERSEKVIKLFKEHILPKFPNKDKVKIICSDAFEYAEKIMPDEKYDFAFVDTWRDASDGLPMYERMKSIEHRSPNCTFSYWIENFIISRRRALRYAELMDKYERGAQDAPKTYDEFIERLTE